MGGPKCVHCGDGIEGRFLQYSSSGRPEDEVPLHVDCKDSYVRLVAPLCDCCGQVIADGGYTKLESATVSAKVHHQCVGAFKDLQNIVGCGLCRGVVSDMTGGIQVVTGDSTPMYLHHHCQDKYKHIALVACSYCGRAIEDSIVQVTDEHSYGSAKLHVDCVDAFKLAHCPVCDGCGEKILSNHYSLVNKRPYHDECTAGTLSGA